MRDRRFKPAPGYAVIMSIGLIPLSGSRNLVCVRRLGIFASVPSSTALLFIHPGPEQVSRLHPEEQITKNIYDAAEYLNLTVTKRVYW